MQTSEKNKTWNAGNRGGKDKQKLWNTKARAKRSTNQRPENDWDYPCLLGAGRVFSGHLEIQLQSNGPQHTTPLQGTCCNLYLKPPAKNKKRLSILYPYSRNGSRVNNDPP